jgi:hypothetical protein
MRSNLVERERDGRRDFDFLHGRWRVHNRRLTERLRGSNVWESFESEVVNWPILGGLGNVDTYIATLPDGTEVHAASLRIYNPATGRWSIHWVDNRRCELFPPTIGRFANGIGSFEGDDTEGDRPVRVRFVWSGIGPYAAHWQQSFSIDGGATWELNWTRAFARVDD